VLPNGKKHRKRDDEFTEKPTPITRGAFLFLYQVVDDNSAIWVRAHLNNYLWVADLGLALCSEYTRRYSTPKLIKVHATESVLRHLKFFPPRKIPNFPISFGSDGPNVTIPIPEAMPEKYRTVASATQFTCQNCHTCFRVLEFPMAQDKNIVKWKCASCKVEQETGCPNGFEPFVISVIEAYRRYYQGEEKKDLAKWTRNEKPTWFIQK
jgi:hypothetical protein